MKFPAPRLDRSFADPSGNILGQNYIPVRPYALIFSGFSFFYSFWIFYFVILFFFFSPFQFLLIHLFLSFSSYLFLFFFVVLFFSSYILNCLLYYRHVCCMIHIRHSEGFFKGVNPFLIHLGCDHTS
jgi:hypothetical protein